ncbi:hypothetical protein, partial [Dactylosporangium fulvum]|uniref:hypothetical protein n=1 Tax=Dactylosporangium fulvum TaxID=53359 RepID=UPI0031CE43FB
MPILWALPFAARVPIPWLFRSQRGWPDPRAFGSRRGADPAGLFRSWRRADPAASRPDFMTEGNFVSSGSLLRNSDPSRVNPDNRADL